MEEIVCGIRRSPERARQSEGKAEVSEDASNRLRTFDGGDEPQVARAAWNGGLGVSPLLINAQPSISDPLKAHVL